jgi:hypothetical protein
MAMAAFDPFASTENLADDDLDAEYAGADARRSQTAVIRALADHIAHVRGPIEADGRGEQLLQEMARLKGWK